MKTQNIFINASLIFTFFCTTVKSQSSVFRDPVSFKLRNGMTIIVAENKATTKVYSSFTIESPADKVFTKPGVEELLTSMLHEAALQEEAGISFSDKGGNLATNIASFEYSLTAFSNTIRNPFNERIFEKAKSGLVESVASNTKYYADLINEDAVQRLTLDDVKAFYKSAMKPAKSTLTIVGNITPAEAKFFAKKAFQDWNMANLS